MRYTIDNSIKTIYIDDIFTIKELNELNQKLTKAGIIDESWNIGFNHVVTYPVQQYYPTCNGNCYTFTGCTCVN